MRTVVRYVVVAIVVLHGMVHLVGTADSSVGTAEGIAWLVAAALVVTAGVLLAVRASGWWLWMLGAAVVSEAMVIGSWEQAKAGTVVNVLMLLAGGYGLAANGPWSLRSEYRRHATSDVRWGSEDEPLTEADLQHLPPVVAAYVRRCGAVGRPRVHGLRAQLHGRIRGGPDQPWMRFTGAQVSTFGPDASRFFFLDATMRGLPVDVLHVFRHGHATMRAEVCSLVPVVDGSGPDLDRAETVTVFNDLCVLAPAALADAPVVWLGGDGHHARGCFTLAGRSVTADLVFDDQADLVDFVSDDRLRASRDGSRLTPQRWSTPVGGYREVAGRRLGCTAEGRWHAPPPEGEFAYLEIAVDDIRYDVAPVAPGAHPEAAPDAPEEAGGTHRS